MMNVLIVDNQQYVREVLLEELIHEEGYGIAGVGRSHWWIFLSRCRLTPWCQFSIWMAAKAGRSLALSKDRGLDFLLN